MTQDKATYIEYCKTVENLPVFFNYWWLDAVSSNGQWFPLLSRNRNNEITGIWPIYYELKLGQKLIKMPPLTPYLGPLIKEPTHLTKRNSIYSYKRKVLNQLIKQLPDFVYFNILCHPSFDQLLPLKWQGFKQTNELSYIINDISDPKSVYDGFESSVRNKINKAENIFIVVQDKNPEPLIKLMEATFQKQGLDNRIKLSFLLNLTKAITENNGRYSIFYAKQDDQYMAGNFIVYDQLTAYNLLAGAEPICVKDGPVPYIVWRAILDASTKVKKFDFEGGLIEPIESFFRSFGAEQMHYSRFIKTKNRLTDLYLLFTGKI